MWKLIFRLQKKASSEDITLLSSLSLFRLLVYILILYFLFTYPTNVYVWIISLGWLTVTFILPYPKAHNWKHSLFGYIVTGGLAYMFIKAGIIRLGIITLIIGLAISSWLAPNLVLLFAGLLALILTSLSGLFYFPGVSHSPQFEIVQTLDYRQSAAVEIDNSDVQIPDLHMPTIPSEEAEKIDEVYHTNIAEELTNIGWEVWEIITNQNKRVEFVASEILSKSIEYIGLIGMVAFQSIVLKRIKERKSDKAKSLRRISTDVEKISEYLQMVTKSRKAEMINATGLSEEQVSALLEYLRSIAVLVHEKACFWRFRTEADK